MGYYTVWFKKKGTYGESYKTVYIATGYNDASKQFWSDHDDTVWEVITINDYK